MNVKVSGAASSAEWARLTLFLQIDVLTYETDQRTSDWAHGSVVVKEFLGRHEGGLKNPKRPNTHGAMMEKFP